MRYAFVRPSHWYCLSETISLVDHTLLEERCLNGKQSLLLYRIIIVLVLP